MNHEQQAARITFYGCAVMCAVTLVGMLVLAGLVRVPRFMV